jgi:hypothetical protein
MTKATDPFDITERNAVAAIGEPSYTSAVHKWNGTMDSLKAKAVNKKIKDKLVNGFTVSLDGSSENERVPAAPYSSEIPKSMMPDEKAEDRIIFIAASEEIFFSRSKLAIAATGMVDNSRERKKIRKFPLEIMRNIPNRADNIRIRNSVRC